MSEGITIQGTAHIIGDQSIKGAITMINRETEKTFCAEKTDFIRVVEDGTSRIFYIPCSVCYVEAE